MADSDRIPPTFVKWPRLIGVATSKSDLKGLKEGLVEAPNVIKKESLGRTVLEYMHKIQRPEDAGNSLDNTQNAQAVIAQHIADTAYLHCMAGRMVLSLDPLRTSRTGAAAGIAKAVCERFRRPRGLGLIWIYTQARIPSTSSYTEDRGIHGTASFSPTESAPADTNDPMKLLLDECKANIGKRAFVGLGLRSLPRSGNKVKRFRLYDVAHLGIQVVMDRVLDHLGEDMPIHLVFDFRDFKATVASGAGNSGSFGLTLRELIYLSERLSKSGRLVSVDLRCSEDMGTGADAVKTFEAAVAIVVQAFGGPDGSANK